MASIMTEWGIGKTEAQEKNCIWGLCFEVSFSEPKSEIKNVLKFVYSYILMNNLFLLFSILKDYASVL